MRSPCFAALFALLAGAASASPLAWQGTLAFDFPAAPVGRVAFTGAGVASVWPGAGAAALHALRVEGGITGSTAVPLSDPNVTATVRSVALSVALGTGTLQPFHPPAPYSQPQLAENTLPAPGEVRLCVLFAGCGVSLDVPLTAGGGAVGVGVGGALAVPGFSLDGAPWTVRTALLSAVTGGGGAVLLADRGWLHGPLSFTGSTALPGGALRLVTPVRITSSDPENPNGLSAFGELTLRFAPEPGRFALLAAALSALALLARRRPHPGD